MFGFFFEIMYIFYLQCVLAHPVSPGLLNLQDAD